METTHAAKPKTVTPRLAVRIWRHFGRPLFFLLIVVWSIRLTIADWRDVPTESMAPTIQPGDRILVNLIAYDFKLPFSMTTVSEWNLPRRGDVIVFRSDDGIRSMVKRVIALPGEYVEVRDQIVYINDVPATYHWPETAFGAVLSDEYRGRAALESIDGVGHPVAFDLEKPNYLMFPRQRVPEGHFFLLGDNRDHSRDSRAIGFVSQDRILGKVYAVAFSMDMNDGMGFRTDRWFRSVH